MMTVGIIGTNKVDNDHRITISLPDARWYKTSYETLDFSGATEWAEFLKRLYGI